MMNILYSFIFTIYYVTDFLIHPRDNTHSRGGDFSTQGWPGTEPGGGRQIVLLLGGRGGKVDVRGGKQCCCRCLIECYCGGGRNWPKNDKTIFFLKNIKKKIKKNTFRQFFYHLPPLSVLFGYII